MALGITRIGLSTTPRTNYFWGGEIHNAEDSISFADSSVATLLAKADITDSFNVNDNSNSIIIFYADAYDSFNLNDSSEVTALFQSNVEESLYFEDFSVARQTFVITIDDPIVLTDSVSAVKFFYSEAIDTINFADNTRYINRIPFITLGELELDDPLSVVSFDIPKINVSIKLDTPSAITDLDNVN